MLPIAACAGTATDGFDPNADAAVRAVAIQADGKTVIAGDFSVVGGQPRQGLARIRISGQLDTTLPNLAIDDSVRAVLIEPSGGIVFGGNFAMVGASSFGRIARLNPDGIVDASFSPAIVGNRVNAITRQTDGKLLIGGDFGNVGGQVRNHLVRLNADGTLDSTFVDHGLNGAVRTIVVQTDGGIIFGGNFVLVDGQPRQHLARLTRNGSLDPSFQPNPNDAVSAIAWRSDGKILIGGSFTSVAGTARNHLARLRADGGIDPGFIANANGEVMAVAERSDGKVLVAGSFTSLSGQPRLRLARLLADGQLDNAFVPQLDASVFAFAGENNGKVQIGGNFVVASGSARNHIARLYPDGTADADFRPIDNGDTQSDTLVMLPDGRLGVGGQFNSIDGQVFKLAFARLNLNGRPDPSFHPELDTMGGLAIVRSLVVQPDGKFLAAGGIPGPGNGRQGIVRVDQNGNIDPNFVQTTFRADPLAMALQPDGKVIVVGLPIAIRLNTDGSADPEFNLFPPTGFGANAVALQSSGKIIIGGEFRNLLGIPGSLFRLDANGQIDISLGCDNTVSVLAQQPDGKILVGGLFTQLAGQPRANLGRLMPDGTLDPSFNPIAGSADGIFLPGVSSIAIQADGKIIVSGFFTLMNGRPRLRIARLNPDGSLDENYGGPVSLGGISVTGLALQDDGKLVAAGFFTQFENLPRQHVARFLLSDEPTKDDFSYDSASRFVAWTRTGALPEFIPSYPPPTLLMSVDGVSYVRVGDLQRVGGSWAFPGLVSPVGSFFLRARGWSTSGSRGGSLGMHETTLFVGSTDAIFADGFE